MPLSQNLPKSMSVKILVSKDFPPEFLLSLRCTWSPKNDILNRNSLPVQFLQFFIWDIRVTFMCLYFLIINTGPFFIAEEASASPGFKPMQVCVASLGWCELAEDDLTPENSSKAVNRYDLPIIAVIPSVINCRCIVDLSSKENENVEKAGVWGNGRELILELDEGSLKLIDPEDGATLNSQPIHAIRVWGVGRDNGRDFAYVSRDKQTRKHMCHVFRLVLTKLPRKIKCSTD